MSNPTQKIATHSHTPLTPYRSYRSHKSHKSHKSHNRISTPLTRSGFTLTELNAVIAIIGIMAAILLPALAKSREAARRASCMANLSQIGMSLNMYADENQCQLPWSGGKGNAECLVPFAQRYHTTVFSFVCPSDAGISVDDLDPDFWKQLDPSDPEYTALNARLDDASNSRTLRGSYDYFGAYTRQPIVMPPATEPSIPKVPLMWDQAFSIHQGENAYADLNHYSQWVNVLWLDGSVTRELVDRFPAINLPFRPAGIEYDDPVNVIPDDEVEEKNR